MRRRPLGRTGRAVSEIGFGCGPTAGLMIDGSPEEQRAVVGRALDLGIDYFDTAPAYGEGASERNLGRCLRELGAGPGEPGAMPVVVATKVALTPADFNAAGGLGAAVERSVEASLERLGCSEVAIVQLHNRVGRVRAPKAPFGTGALLSVDDVLGAGGVVEGFRRLRDRGLVRWFGCSAYGGEMHAVGQLIDSAAFDVLTVHYSSANPSAWNPTAHNADPDYQGVGARAVVALMGVAGLRVLEGGLLAGDVDAALRFALSNGDLSCVIVGFSTRQQVEQAVALSYSL